MDNNLVLSEKTKVFLNTEIYPALKNSFGKIRQLSLMV